MKQLNDYSFLIIKHIVIEYSMLSKTKIKGKSKENESALRHKVRNLRAKVRLLLPM